MLSSKEVYTHSACFITYKKTALINKVGYKRYNLININLCINLLMLCRSFHLHCLTQSTLFIVLMLLYLCFKRRYLYKFCVWKSTIHFILRVSVTFLFVLVREYPRFCLRLYRTVGLYTVSTHTYTLRRKFLIF